MKRVPFLLVMLVIALSLAAFLLVGCSQDDQQATGEFKHGKTVWLLMPYTGEHWWTTLVEYLKQPIEADGWKFEFATAEGSDTTQYEQIITYAQQADILFICPVSREGVNEAIRIAEEEYHCPVVVYKDAITGKASLCAQYSDYDAGLALAKECVQWLEEKYGSADGRTVVALNGDLSSHGWKLRQDGFRWIKENYPNVNFIEVTGGFEPDGWADAIDAALGGAAANVDAILSGSDGAYLLGALEALQKHGKLYYVGDPNHVWVGSIDGKTSTLMWLRNGLIDVVYSQTPDSIAKSLWQIAKEHLLKDPSYQSEPYELHKVPIPLEVKQPEGCYWGGTDKVMVVENIADSQTPTGTTPAPRIDRNNVNTWELWGHSSIKVVGPDLDPIPEFEAKGTRPEWCDQLIAEYEEWLKKQ